MFGKIMSWLTGYHQRANTRNYERGYKIAEFNLGAGMNPEDLQLVFGGNKSWFSVGVEDAIADWKHMQATAYAQVEKEKK